MTFRIVGTALLLLLQGYLIGRIVDVHLAEPESVTVVPEVREPFPTVRIHGIRNGYLEGDIIGNARFFLAEEEVQTASGTAFQVLADAFLRNEVQVVVPPGMHYVASRSGKKYYSVTSAAGERIVPKNRIYFRSAADAQRAGYIP